MGSEQDLAKVFLKSHPQEAAPILEKFSSKDVSLLLHQLNPQEIAKILHFVIPSLGGFFLSEMEPDLLLKVFSQLDPQKILLYLRNVSRQKRDAILKALPMDLAKNLKTSLRYPKGTAGYIMEPLVFVLPQEITVEEAIRRVRKLKPQAFHYPYVVNRNQQLLGVLALRDLMLADSKTIIGSILQKNIGKIYVGWTYEQILAHPAWHRITTLPVVDEEEILLGVLQYQNIQNLFPSTKNVSSLPLDLSLAMGEMFWVGLLNYFHRLLALIAPISSTTKIEKNS